MSERYVSIPRRPYQHKTKASAHGSADHPCSAQYYRTKLQIETERPHQERSDSLLPRIRRVLIRRVAIHPIIRDLPRVRHRVAPERLRLDPEISHHAPRHVAQRERDRAAVAVLARARRVVRPPRLAVPVDPARRVRVDDEVAAGDDEPGGLGLDEDDAVGVGGVQPVLDVWLELGANVMSGMVVLEERWDAHAEVAV